MSQIMSQRSATATGPRGGRVGSVMFPLLGVLLLVAAWWAVKAVTGWSAFILPSPADVVLAGHSTLE